MGAGGPGTNPRNGPAPRARAGFPPGSPRRSALAGRQQIGIGTAVLEPRPGAELAVGAGRLVEQRPAGPGLVVVVFGAGPRPRELVAGHVLGGLVSSRSAACCGRRCEPGLHQPTAMTTMPATASSSFFEYQRYLKARNNSVQGSHWRILVSRGSTFSSAMRCSLSVAHRDRTDLWAIRPTTLVAGPAAAADGCDSKWAL